MALKLSLQSSPRNQFFALFSNKLFKRGRININESELPKEPHNVPKFNERWNYPKPDVPAAETYTPAKLLAVWRTQTLGGRPYNEKMIMVKLGLHLKEKSDPLIVKNTPAICDQLWKIKHLIRVRPITFPYGEPKEGECAGSWLDHNGVFKVSKKLDIDPSQMERDEEYDRTNFDDAYISEYCLKKWNSNYDYDCIFPTTLNKAS